MDPDTDIEETLSALSDPDPQRESPCDWIVQHSCLRDHRGPVGGRAARIMTVPYRTAPYSILSRGIESEVLPLAERYGMAYWCGVRSAKNAHRSCPEGVTDRCSPCSHPQGARRRAPARCCRAGSSHSPKSWPADDAPSHGVRDHASGVTSALLGPTRWSNSTTCSSVWTSYSQTSSRPDR